MYGGSRGFRGGGGYSGPRGRGRGSGPFTVTAAIYARNPNNFVVHPRSKYNALGLSTSQLQVEEIGFYSLDGNVENLTVRLDRSAMRKLTTKCDSSTPAAVNFNLDEPFEWEDPDAPYFSVNEFTHLHRWMAQEEHSDVFESKREEIQIITTKSILSKLLEIPYYHATRNVHGWMFGAAKVDGKVILGRIDREESDHVFLKDVTNPDGAQQYEPNAFRGRRFEVLMTQDEGNGAVGPLGSSRFRSVTFVQLLDLKIMVEAGVDAIDPNLTVAAPKSYVELTILPAGILDGQNKSEMNFFGRRLLYWWCNSVFMGMESINVGVHNDGIANEIHFYEMEAIPRMVKQKEEELKEELWSDTTCLGFIYELLKFVIRSVSDDCAHYVYEFTCRKDIGVFLCEAVSTSVAVGHTYLPESPG